MTRDLLPVAFVAANERRLDDELFVTAWLWEEGKHADFFRRYLDEVVGDDLVEPQELGRRLLEIELPAASEPVAPRFEPGRSGTSADDVLPDRRGGARGHGTARPRGGARGARPPARLRTGLLLVNRDESRHVAYGLHVLKRLMEADAKVPDAVRERVEELTPLVTGLADTIILRYETRPFGLSYALGEPIQRLLAQLERLRRAAV